MQNVNIMNPQVQSLLEEFEIFFLNQQVELTNNYINGDNPDYCTGDEYLESIMLRAAYMYIRTCAVATNIINIVVVCT